jgi:hypothetical protein
MEKSKYNQMVHAQEKERLDKYSQAWSIVFSAMARAEWTPIPQETKAFLGLHPSIGGCSGMLITRNSAMGINDFIARMNRKRG